MENPLNYFDKTFVISAKDNQERREYAKRVLSELNIEFEFFDAIIGNDLSDEELEAVYDEERAKQHKTYKRRLSKPEIGCTLSHMAIYQKIIDQDLDHALIFEDDLDPVFDDLSVVEQAIKELPENWDMLYLGTMNHDAKASFSYKMKLLFYYPLIKTFFPSKIDYDYKHLWNIYPRNYSKTLKRAGHHQGLHAYAMSQRGAKKFLDYHDKIVTAPDYMPSVMIMEEKLEAFLIKPLIFGQNKDLESALEAARLEIRKEL